MVSKVFSRVPVVVALRLGGVAGRLVVECLLAAVASPEVVHQQGLKVDG